jgi:hypothetical protein
MNPHLETLEDRTVPSTMAGNWADGVWRWDSVAGWGHISDQQATQLTVDSAGNVFGTFADGTWRWSAATMGWQKMSELQAEAIGVSSGGVFYGAFGSAGTWRWSFDGWQQISSLDAEAFVVAGNDTFFGSFATASVGTWRWTPTNGWLLMTSNRPDSLQTDPSGDFLGVFQTHIDAAAAGTWVWSSAQGWRRDTTVWAQVELGTTGMLLQDRGTLGLWGSLPFVGAASSVHLSGSTSDGMWPLANGDFLLVLASASASATLFHDSSSGVFNSISANATALSFIVAGKDGDAFLAFAGAGVWQWSSAGGLVLLGGADPTLMASQV